MDDVYGRIVLRLNRAREHIREWHQDAATYMGRQPWSIIQEYDEYDHCIVLRIFVIEDPPPSLTILAGDAVHNMRSSLDNLIWQIVTEAGGTPGHSTAFPIATSSTDYNSRCRKMLEGMSEAAKRVVEAVQPYHDSVPTRHPLAQLNEYSRWDKHRLPLNVLGLMDPIRITAVSPRRDVTIDTPPVIRTAGGISLVVHGAEIAQISARATGDQPAVAFEADHVVSLAFGPPLSGVPVAQMLDNAYGVCRTVFGELLRTTE